MHRPLSRQGTPLCIGTYPIPGRPLSIGVYGLLDRHRGVGVYAFSYRPLSDRGLSLFEQAGTFLTLTPAAASTAGDPPAHPDADEAQAQPQQQPEEEEHTPLTDYPVPPHVAFQGWNALADNQRLHKPWLGEAAAAAQEGAVGEQEVTTETGGNMPEAQQAAPELQPNGQQALAEPH